MREPIRVMIQVRSTPALVTAAFSPVTAAPALALDRVSGVQFDASYSPVPIPPKLERDAPRPRFGMAVSYTATAPSTYVVRASVEAGALPDFLAKTKDHPDIVGVFSDPRIQPIAVCPNGPIGTDRDIEELLLVKELQRRGLDGTGVKVVIVDTGFNLGYLERHGKTPAFNAELSWGPLSGQSLGNMPLDHGTMCAYDACIAAPRCTLIDHAVLTAPAQSGPVMDGLLSDAVRSYGILLISLTRAAKPFAGDHTPHTLVVSNSWGMFHPSWDFPVGDPQNYSDNPDHPFNIIVDSLEAAGADILFAAGNCGPECPDGRCQGATNAGIYGANSSGAVTCVAGVVKTKVRIGYSTKGPGRLEKKKPDLACFTHFAGSGVYAADGGTSAATPVAAGVVAAVRRLYPASVLPPAELRDLLRDTAEKRDGSRFNYEYGHGVINVQGLLQALDARGGALATGPSAPKSKKAARPKKQRS